MNLYSSMTFALMYFVRLTLTEKCQKWRESRKNVHMSIYYVTVNETMRQETSAHVVMCQLIKFTRQLLHIRFHSKIDRRLKTAPSLDLRDIMTLKTDFTCYYMQVCPKFFLLTQNVTMELRVVFHTHLITG